MTNSKKGLAGGLVAICLLLSLGANFVHAGSFTPLPLTVTGTVLDTGSQTYTMSGGSVLGASIDGLVLDPRATLTFTITAQVDGFATSGSASFNLVGTTGGGAQSVTADGTILITDEAAAAALPLGCTTSCNSELPLFFLGGSSTTVTISGGAPSTTAPDFYLESPYFNPWGTPMVIASSDCYNAPFTCTFSIATTYNAGTIQWQGTETSGAVTGTLGGSPVTGVLNITSQETEDLVAGTASDSGTIALLGMSPSVLDVQGTYTGTSVIPTDPSAACTAEEAIFSQPCTADCSSLLTGFPGTCTETGFESVGQAAMQNTQIGVNGTYTTDWGVPALGYYSSLNLSYDNIDPAITCTSAVIQASANQWPTIGLNGSPLIDTPNATNTLSFYVTMPDAVPAAWLTGGCTSQDAASFSQLQVTRVAYRVDGGALQNATFSFTKHGEFECYTASSMALMDNWQGCSGSLSVVQVWSGSITFTVMPTGQHSVTLEAWGQNGAGPFTTNLIVSHSLYSFSGQPFMIAARGLAGTPIVVKCSGLEPMLTSKGTILMPVTETYNTIVPQSGIIYGSFLHGGVVTVYGQSALDVWSFTLGNGPQNVQQLTLGSQ